MLRFRRGLSNRYIALDRVTYRGFSSANILGAVEHANKTQGKNNNRRFPLDDLNKGFSKRLQGVKGSQTGLNELYTDFKRELSELKQDNKIKFNNNNVSYRLNEFVTSLLRTITDSKDGGSDLDPYQVLDQLTSYNLINAGHYALVLKYYLLVQKDPKDVISLWVKYLESNVSGNQMLMALTTIAFLRLPDNTKPDFKILKQILQTDKLKTEIPFGRISGFIEQTPELNTDSQLKHNFEYMYNDYITQNPEWFISQIQGTHTRKRLQSMYKLYVGTNPEAPKSVEILKVFMDTFLNLEGKPTDAIEVFNQYKNKFTGADLFELRLKLLEVVSKLQGRNKTQKLERILAVWNSFIKPTLEENNESKFSSRAFATLINALDNSGNVHELQKIWDNEVPTNIKSDQYVFEAFLLAMIRRTQINYKQIKEKLVAANITNIQSQKLLEAISIRVLKENPKERELFDQFVSENNLTEKSNDPGILAIRTYADYLYSKSDPNHTFLIANDVRSKILKTKPDITNFEWKHDLDLVLHKFIEIAPSIEPVRDLYEQNGTYQLNFFILEDILTAEFRKPGGSIEQAEKIFEDLLKLDNKKLSGPMKVNVYQLLDSMIKGLCNNIGRSHDISLLETLKKYLNMVRGLDVHITPRWVEYIMGTIRRIVRTEKPGKVDPEVISFIDNFLKKLPSLDPTFNLKLRENDISMLKSIGSKAVE